jgi:NDP-sugar pyrophosphorylase family protein
MHIANPGLFDYMHEGIYSLIDLYLRLAAEHQIFTLKHDEGYWIDVGTPESLQKVRELLAGNQ